MTITRVSVDSAGNQGNRFSEQPSTSADGRFVAFASDASNLVPGDTNNNTDIFVRDRLTNTTTRVSVDSAGQGANNFSNSPSISADGRFVRFNSVASNLVPGNTNNISDIFVRDTIANTTTRVSVPAGQGANSGSGSPFISPEGRFVAFSSFASNLVPGDTNNNFDVFVRDLSTNTTTLVSVDSAGNQGKSGSGGPSISADGRFVAFISGDNLVPEDTNNTQDIFVRDLSTNTTTRISVDSAGNQANDFSYSPSISADGRFVAFQSAATNLVPGDTNNNADIFVRDLSTNTTTLVSVSSRGDRANTGSGTPSISADGRFVAFTSLATNLAPGDTKNQSQIFVRDRLTNTTTLVSVDSAGNPGNTPVGPSGNQGNTGSNNPSISADGRFVVFDSDATNLVPGDTNNSRDIFVADITSTPGVINNPPNTINGTPANDYLTGTPSSDNINGFEGDDTLAGLRGNDILNGGDGSDILFGGKGFDTLNGGLGNDLLIGGVGNDVFVLGAGLGIDTISDFTNGVDTVQLINGLNFRQLSISAATNGTLISVTSSGEVLASLTGVGLSSIGPEDFLSV
ncbi:calcium-binding protein [Microcoleus sp. ARI1-B5]|uniref:calcium-binding protein n=1 Tax=unclassified Microcoleus TaxID=2642155 RepID=UPI002FD2387F